MIVPAAGGKQHNHVGGGMQAWWQQAGAKARELNERQL
jgi:hypothetical protein